MAKHHGPPDPMHHVKDATEWEFFHYLTEPIPLPAINLGFYEFQITKFMLLELIAAAVIIGIYVPLARRASSGNPPKGAWWNCFEVLLTFIRDEVARPALISEDQHHHDDEHGEHHGDTKEGAKKLSPEEEADRYVPFLWTIFLFVLVCNLLGMLPFMGSPTASIHVTGALALCSFVMMHGVAIAKMGFFKYVHSLWPQIDVPLILGLILKPMIFIIELFGTVIKSVILAVRLFANLFAGHLVLAFIMTFIFNAAALGWFGWGSVTVATLLMLAGLSLLELFVAFLQAYIFTFLTALFMGMALHPQH